MQKGYDLFPTKYSFKYFTRLQSACGYQGKLQTNYAVLTFCDFNHRVFPELAARSAAPGVSPGRGLLIPH